MRPKGPPAPPKNGPPAPPKKGRPLPPSGIGTLPKINNFVRANTLEGEGKYQEAAVLYQEGGDTNSANRCLQLALANSRTTTITNIHDSVIMNDD